MHPEDKEDKMERGITEEGAKSSSVSKEQGSSQDSQKVKYLTEEVKNLRDLVSEQRDEIDTLRKKQENMNDRLRAQERYTRKDSVLIVNLTFDARKVNDVTAETLQFFARYLKVSPPYDSIKACHVLPGKPKGDSMPTVICKFLYFDHKHEIWQKKRKLRNFKNFKNNLNMYINEPLPECEAQIQAEANKRDIITSTHNCVVSVLVADGSRSKFKAVHDVNELDTLNTIKRARNHDNDRSPLAKKTKPGSY